MALNRSLAQESWENVVNAGNHLNGVMMAAGDLGDALKFAQYGLVLAAQYLAL